LYDLVHSRNCYRERHFPGKGNLRRYVSFVPAHLSKLDAFSFPRFYPTFIVTSMKPELAQKNNFRLLTVNVPRKWPQEGGKGLIVVLNIVEATMSV